MRPRPTRVASGALATVTVAVGSLLAGSVAVAAPAPAAAPTTSATAASPSGDGVPVVRLTPDPSYQQPAFEGWGTSLVWFANATGDYPDAVRNKLADLVFGKDGLALNIARYNIGGGNAPDVEDYLRPGGAVQGWWKAPEGTTRTDVDWWSPDDAADWNWDADQTQRWWVDRIKGGITKWETFSNSPPWFMTESGYVSAELQRRPGPAQAHQHRRLRGIPRQGDRAPGGGARHQGRHHRPVQRAEHELLGHPARRRRPAHRRPPGGRPHRTTAAAGRRALARPAPRGLRDRREDRGDGRDQPRDLRHQLDELSGRRQGRRVADERPHLRHRPAHGRA